VGETLVLTRRDVSELLTLAECIEAVEEAFRLHAEGKSLAPGVLGVPSRGGKFHVKAAGLERGRPYFAAKTNGNFPENPRRHGLPAIQGVLVLCDAEDGRPLAVMDSMEITLRRTAAATAVAAKRLARPDSATVAICGCGVQGAAQLRALTHVLPLKTAYAFDADEARATAFARELSGELGLDVRAVGGLEDALARSAVCVTCTPSRRPLLFRGQVAPGTFVAAVGADSHDKQELDAGLMAVATVVADVVEQCAVMGDLHHALLAGAVRQEDVAELGDVVAGRRPGRRSSEEITIFDSTGTAIQDVAAAAVVYERAQASGAGLRVALGE
jgi:ornithine cyclodeaminase/alanine dehydrogenase-like protein (mu-crystallin family)